MLQKLFSLVYLLIKSGISICHYFRQQLLIASNRNQHICYVICCNLLLNLPACASFKHHLPKRGQQIIVQKNSCCFSNVFNSNNVSRNTVTFHFRDGHTESREFLDKRHGTPWTEERREKARESMKAAWTDERREAMSERIKKIRSEKKWPNP